ncbi:ATP-dependent DNA ligase [Mesorhizobium sp. M4A.F.Ca.ET.050.02.1.1]|uniref:ATP-dependent DNA ligase n=1 Tax=unclassified Mesorhizobium TaxID=325217 RepID=UPI000FCCC6CD|nr:MULTISPECIES: ATP-dependent DNA ligase [unclassified Mesorhizobium]RUX45356.1 ATP-dependent DNA ligase [Mesorhizobium sp. M4A.F.Ca.ET.050.02.1.1]RWD29297.1 MAG: ATP-dependent DNA ligase [Mesorhizobium sp.]TIT95792.1 MAG: ATP-dependent DNA ligase [Mesorhizobium sp.]TIW25451.1 MAG: ATP-dependent DNA ligase [Mesorhizobium sp.]
MRLKFIEPLMPTLVDRPPEGDGWIHEVKFDGYRSQIIIDDAEVRIFTRRGLNWTAKYGDLVDTAKGLNVQSAIIDGEIIVLNDAGVSDFGELRTAITRRQHDLYFVAFDLLHLNGHDLRDMPLEDRREILEALVPADQRIQFSEALPGSGAAVFLLVDQAGLEGVVSKRKDSKYRSGPSTNWLKAKCYVEKEMDIIGVQREAGKPAMVLMADNGRYMGGAFVTFKADKRQALWDRVAGKTGAPAPKGLAKEKAEWLKPGLVGLVKFLKGEEKLRHASLKDFWEAN